MPSAGCNLNEQVNWISKVMTLRTCDYGYLIFNKSLSRHQYSSVSGQALSHSEC
jgi:hypothetical protein